jgi:hypothetical protein
MSYPRNAASPPRIAIGPVVQITDGAVQTSGVSVCVRAEGGAETAGGGTVSYGTLSGIVYYTPTQAETDYTAFVVVAYKTGCIPAQVTIATSASATAGYSGIDWGKVTAATSTVNLSGTTISTSQVVASVSGSVGSISGVTFPSNFDALLINASGHVSRVVLVDTTTTNSDMRGTDNAALASSWTSTRAGYLDSVLLAQNSNQRTVQVTGSNHIAADVHEFQTGVLTSDATAASFVTEVQSGLATAANQTTILNRLGSWTGSGLNTILGAFRALAGKAASLTPSDISSGTTYDNTTDSLEAIRDRGDAAWAPGEAGSGDASQSTLLAVQDQVEAIAGTLGGTAISVTSRIADGGAMVIYTGDDLKVRSGTQVTVSISDAAGGIYSRLSALGASKLSWGAARPSQAAGAISGTISSITQSGSGADQVVNLVIEILDAGQSLNPADDYIWQVVSTSGSGDEYTEIEGTLDLRRRVAVPV